MRLVEAGRNAGREIAVVASRQDHDTGIPARSSSASTAGPALAPNCAIKWISARLSAIESLIKVILAIDAILENRKTASVGMRFFPKHADFLVVDPHAGQAAIAGIKLGQTADLDEHR